MDQIAVILQSQKRLARIRKLRAEGKTLQAIATLEGCSRQRVNTILRRAEERARLPDHVCPDCGFPFEGVMHRRECGRKKKRA